MDLLTFLSNSRPIWGEPQVMSLQETRLVAVVFLFLSTVAQAIQPHEHFDHATVVYDCVTKSRGEKLRTFVTHPNDAAGKFPVVFFVGWLSCDSMEFPDANTQDGFGIFLRRLIEQSGYATVRMDKPGVGESQGDCSKADFQSEMEGWQAAFDSMSKYDFIDLDRVLVAGLSNGEGSLLWQPAVIRSAALSHADRGVELGLNTCWIWNVAV